jgi:oxygen-independent coproporphyrinogen-3 oxidase
MIEEGTKYWEIYGEGENTKGKEVDDRDDVKLTNKETEQLSKGKYDNVSDDVKIPSEETERISKEKDIYKSDVVRLPDEEIDRLMYEMTKEVLGKKGYLRYEISNYAKEGLECRHNLGYWDRVNYLGLGLGSASLIENTRFNQESDLEKYLEIFLHRELKELTDKRKVNTNESGLRGIGIIRNRYTEDGYVEKEDVEKEYVENEDVENEYVENRYTKSRHTENGYIENGLKEKGTIEKGYKEIISLSEKEQMGEFMFLGLRKTKGISRNKFYEDFGKNIDEIYGEVLLRMERESLIEIDNDYIRLTARGIDVSNYVFTVFI